MKKKLIRTVAGGLIFFSGLGLSYIEGMENASICLFILSYIMLGGDVLVSASRKLIKGISFDESLLMSIATIGALCIGALGEAAAVMLFYQAGELFQSYAVARSRKSIADLMDIRPDHANLKTESGEICKVPPEQVKTGDEILIKPGERIPIDSVVSDGISLVDLSMLTGEPLPREVRAGDEILSGSVNINGTIRARTIRAYGESTASRILELVENAGARKSQSEKFITKFARVYTPSVVALAALMAVVPPFLIDGASFTTWVYRALMFLVVSCPCALVISIPLAFFGGICGAARNGILVKGGNCLETLAKTDCVVFDKTGTLTRGALTLKSIHPEGITPEKLLELAALADSFSSHPVSAALLKAYGQTPEHRRVSEAREEGGFGVSAKVDGNEVIIGSLRMMEKHGIIHNGVKESGTAIHLAVNGVYSGYIVLGDELKSDAHKAIAALKALGTGKIAMLTGDSRRVAEDTGRSLGIDPVHAELLPGEKLEKLEELINARRGGGKLVFVGDGINDAPALARADIGVAMGGLGSDAAIEAADMVLMTDEPSKIPFAIKLSQRTVGIARQNIILTLGVKAAVLVFCALGMAIMWEAVFADVGVMALAALNAMRAMKKDISMSSGEVLPEKTAA